MTLREYILRWQEVYDKNQSRPTTYAAHGYIFKNHILPGLGEIPLSELTVEQVGDFLEERRRFGGHRPESPEYPGLGEHTMRHIHRLLQQCLDQAIRDGLITDNPARAFHYPKPRQVSANVLTPAEAEDYLDAAERLGHLPMFLLALTAGLRQGELIALKWSDLDVKKGTLTITEKRSVERRELVEYEGGTRIVSLTSEAVELLHLEHAKHPGSPLIFKVIPINGYSKEYGYLPKSVKKTVDEVVDKLEELPVVRVCYDQWCRLQGEVESYYHDKPRERKKLSQEKEFRQIKNAVIQEAERIRLGEISFEDDGISQTDEPEHVRNESQACRELWRIIRNEDISLDYRDRAAEKLEQVAERGDAYAQYRMGQLYRDGPLLIPDNHKAKHWLSQAAKQGLPEAQYALGKLLLSDDWEVRDPDEGIHWLKQAAENGSHFAAYRLGKEYLEGNAVNKDTSRAADWFTKSAEAGNQYAQYMLGKLYLMGQGLPRDQAQATVWFSRSAAQGNQYAQFFLEQRNNLRPPSVMLAVTQLLYHISRIFEDNSVPSAVPVGQQVDRKLRRKIQEKKIAMGHKPDDHEEQWPEMTM